MKHFSELTEKEINTMINKLIGVAISYAEAINMSGLSESGSHNIYNAIEDSIMNEWKQSKQQKVITK